MIDLREKNVVLNFYERFYAISSLIRYFILNVQPIYFFYKEKVYYE